MKAELESELKFTKQEASYQSKTWLETIETLERKLNEKQTEIWRNNMIS